MKQIIFCIIALLSISNYAFAQQSVAISSTSKIKPYKFDVIQNNYVSFSMVISPNEVLENEEDAQFLIFTNATSNALFIQNNDKEALFEVELLDNNKKVVATKSNLEEIMLLDLSIHKKGVYNLKLTTKGKVETHKIILR